MLKCIKLAVFTIFAAFIFGFIAYGESVAVEIPTPEEFVEYLEKKGDLESLELKERFSQFSLKKKQKLLRYFFDPEVIKNIYSKKVEPDSTKVLYDGDIVIEDKTNVTEDVVEDKTTLPTVGCFWSSVFFRNVFAAPVVKEYTASHVRTYTHKYFGDVKGTIQFHAWVKYRVVNGTVKKILTHGATVQKKLVCNIITKIQCSKYIMGNKAHCEAVWNVAVSPFKTKFYDISPIDLNVHHEVHGYPNGRTTYSYWS